MKTISILIIINFVCGQANYQILNSSSSFDEIFKNYQVEDEEYSFFHTAYPGEIDSYSISLSLNRIIKQQHYDFYLNFQSLDFGVLKDNISNYTFSANENLVQIFTSYNVNQNLIYLLGIGFIDSNIDKYQSNGMMFDAQILYTFSNNTIVGRLENYGKIFKHYSSTSINLPSILSISLYKDFRPFKIIINYEYDLNLKDYLYTISSKFKINNSLNLYLGLNSNRKDLIHGDYVDELVSGIKFGASFKFEEYIFNIATQNMGAAGYSNSISLKKIIL